MTSRLTTIVASCLLAACASRCSPARPPPPPPPPVGTTEGTPDGGSLPTGTQTAPGSVLEHHGGPSRTGVYVDPTLTRAAAAGFHLDPTFQAPLRGPIHAQPLYVAGTGGKDVVIAATEQNEVAALDAATGAKVWSRTLGTPVPLSSLLCGNIDPLGITGTPVVDGGTRTLYVDAMTTPDGGATKRHLVFALSVDDGSIRPGWPVAVADVARANGLAFDDALQNQRGALALVGGMLYVPFGGHFGDCGDYRGWVFALPVANPTTGTAWSTTAQGGGVWAPSGVSSDGAHVFAATGNTFGAKTWAGGETIARFVAGAPLGASPDDFFTPTNWQQLDAGDIDIGGTGPLPLDVPGATPSALVVGLGKDGNIYLVDRAHMGGIGNPVAVARVSTVEIINAAAAYTTAQGTYVVFKGAGASCPAGQGGELVAVRIVPGAPPSVTTAWCAHQHGTGSPMVTTTDGQAEAIVWGVGAENDFRLHGVDGDTGQVVYDGGGAQDVIGEMARYTTAMLAKGRVFVAAKDGIKAFHHP